MKKIMELKNKIQVLKAEATDLANSNEIEKAKSKIEEIKNLTNELEVLEEVENLNNSSLTGVIVNDKGSNDDDDEKINNKVHVKAFAKAIAKKNLNENEIKALSSNTDEDGGYLIPKDIVTRINILSREHVSLRDLVTVVPVTTKEGHRILEKDASRTGFVDIEELTDIPSVSNPKWAKIDYKIRDLGGLLPIPNSLLEDETGGLVEHLALWFVQKMYATDNAMILFADGLKGSQGVIGTAKLKAAITETDNVFEKEVLTEVLTFQKLKTVLNKSFPRTIAAVAKIITNQSGLDILDNMEDKNGRPYLTGDGTQEFPYKFKGKKVIVYDDETLVNDITTPESPLVPFIVGDLKQGVVLWDRKKMSVATSKEAGFVNNSTIMRGIVRQDTRIWDKKAVKVIYSKLA